MQRQKQTTAMLQQQMCVLVALNCCVHCIKKETSMDNDEHIFLDCLLVCVLRLKEKEGKAKDSSVDALLPAVATVRKLKIHLKTSGSFVIRCFASRVNSSLNLFACHRSSMPVYYHSCECSTYSPYFCWFLG